MELGSALRLEHLFHRLSFDATQLPTMGLERPTLLVFHHHSVPAERYRTVLLFHGTGLCIKNRTSILPTNVQRPPIHLLTIGLGRFTLVVFHCHPVPAERYRTPLPYHGTGLWIKNRTSILLTIVQRHPVLQSSSVQLTSLPCNIIPPTKAIRHP